MMDCPTPCPLCAVDIYDGCACDPATPGYYHPDPEIDGEVRAQREEGRAFDRAAGILDYHKRRAP